MCRSYWQKKAHRKVKEDLPHKIQELDTYLGRLRPCSKGEIVENDGRRDPSC